MTEARAQERIISLMKTLKDNTVAVNNHKSNRDAKINQITAEYTGKMKVHEDAIKKAEEELEMICDNHKQLFEDGAVVTPFGAVGYRKSPGSLQVDDENAALAFIKKSRKKIFETFVKIKESLDKNAIKKALQDGAVTEAELEKGGMSLVSEMKWKYAVDSNKI